MTVQVPLPRLLRIVYDSGGLDAVLSLTRAIGGQRVFVPRQPSDSHPLVTHGGRAVADALAQEYGPGDVEFPLGHKAVHRLLAKALVEQARAQNPPRRLADNELAAALRVSRRHAIRLRKLVEEHELHLKAKGARPRPVDPRQIDIEEFI